MNERINELIKQSYVTVRSQNDRDVTYFSQEKFAELIVREMCGMMEQAEDDAYHCFEPSERPTEYIEWLRDWQERFKKRFGIEK